MGLAALEFAPGTDCFAKQAMSRPLNAALLLLALLPGCAVALRPVQQLHLSEGHQQRANDEDDRVLHVPGYRGQLKSNHYAGGLRARLRARRVAS